MTQDPQAIVGNNSAEPCALLWPPRWGTEKPNLVTRFWVPTMLFVSGAFFAGLGVATGVVASVPPTCRACALDRATHRQGPYLLT